MILRKICPEDHRFASQGLPSDDKWWSSRSDYSYSLAHGRMCSCLFFILPTGSYGICEIEFNQMGKNGRLRSGVQELLFSFSLVS